MAKHEIIDFFENYILKYIVNDLKRLDDIKPDKDGLGACTIPQAISTFAVADLIGYLINKDESKEVTKMSIMGLLKNTNYFKAFGESEVEQDFFIYLKDNVRSMLVHRFSLSKFDIIKDEADSLFLHNEGKLVFNVSCFTKLVLNSIDKVYEGLLDETLIIPGSSFEESLQKIHNRLSRLYDFEKGESSISFQFPSTTTTQTTESISRKKDS